MTEVTVHSDLRAQEIKLCHCFNFFPLYICHEVMGLDAMLLVFWIFHFKPAFSLSSFTFIKRLFSSSSFSTLRVLSSAYLRLLIFLPAVLIFWYYYLPKAYCLLTPWKASIELPVGELVLEEIPSDFVHSHIFAPGILICSTINYLHLGIIDYPSVVLSFYIFLHESSFFS